MKAFRGTIVAALMLVVVAGLAFLVKPDLFQAAQDPVGHPRLFEFEKHELVRAKVERPGAETIVLVETDGRWIIEGTDFVAGRSMVNRIKHQIHDLSARATVIEGADAPELYGLGSSSTRVHLTMRDGREITFLAGDPNPSSVSYYLQREGDSIIYTVKKAAVDYYSLTLEEFRERRFASFDSKDANRIAYTVVGNDPVVLERVEDDWEMRAPLEMRANLDRVKRLLGRVSALKAKRFREGVSEADIIEMGLTEPRANIEVQFASRDPMAVEVGADAPSDNKYDELAYVRIVGDDTVYIAKRGLLDDFDDDPLDLRNRRVVEMKSADVVAVDAILRPQPDEDLEGEAGVRYAAEQWVWQDGVPVPGSTPSRVAKRLSELEVVEFIEENPKNLTKYGLEPPVAEVTLTDVDGAEKVVTIGGEGEPLISPEGDERPRRFVQVQGRKPVYLVDDGVLKVVHDMVREHNRKKKRDEEKAARRERIETVMAKEEGEP